MHDNFIVACGGNIVILNEVKDPSGSERDSSHSLRMTKPKKKGAGFGKIREKHPNAYKPWTAGQDEELKDFFANDMGLAELAKTFGRKTGAIRSRLVKLGLLDE